MCFLSSVNCYRLRNDGSNLIKDRKYHLTTYKQAFVGREFVDWLISRGEASSRIEAVDIGKQLLDAGVFRHGMHLHIIRTCIYIHARQDFILKGATLSSKLSLMWWSGGRVPAA